MDLPIDLSRSAPIEENERGGRQSTLPVAFYLLPPEALTAAARVFYVGVQKYLPNNWRKIPRRDHINHVFAHLIAYMAGDEQDGDPETHLEHALARIMMAVAVPESEEYPYTKVE